MRQMRNTAIVLALTGAVLLGWGWTERVNLPPIGPLPCPKSRLFEIAESRWSNPVDRQSLLVRVGAKYGRRAQEQLSRAAHPGLAMGPIMSDLVSTELGKSPSPAQFTTFMTSLGLKCRDVEIPINSPELPGGVEIHCEALYPAGCPVKYGYWPTLVSGGVAATAIYTAKPREFFRASYNSGAAIGP